MKTNGNRLSLESIKSQFEHKSFSVRSDFIQDYDFKDSFRDYYLAFIRKAVVNVKTPLYLSDLIDLSSYLGIEDSTIVQIYADYCLNHKSLLVRISCMDYFIESNIYYQEELELTQALLMRLSHTDLSFLEKNMILLMLLAREDSGEYLNMFCSSLQKTDDWRSFHRTLLVCLRCSKLIKYHGKIAETISSADTSILSADILSMLDDLKNGKN